MTVAGLLVALIIGLVVLAMVPSLRTLWGLVLLKVWDVLFNRHD